MELTTILVPVDLSPRTDRALGLAGELALASGARLVLLHNEPAAPLGMSRAWDWEQQHPGHHGRGATVDQALRRLLGALPADVRAEAVLSRGMPLTSILEVARRLPADLVVLESAGPDGDDHASITDRLLAESPCPVLALQEGHDEGRPLLPGATETAAEVLVATDFSASGDAAVRYAVALARLLPLRLRLLHALTQLPHTPAASIGASDAPVAVHTAVGDARRHLLALVPEDLRERVTLQVVGGNAKEAIVEACGVAPRPSFVVMGEHAKGLRGVLTRDTARAVLRGAPCPVLYVPPPATT
jgi:nucleotide-binding universal stress UspA family protein